MRSPAAADSNAEATPDDIPTLAIEVATLQIPTLAEPVDGMREIRMRPGARGRSAANTVERVRPMDAGRRTSRRIIAAVAFGLLAVASIASLLEATDDGAESAAAVAPAQVQIPTLVLLSESARAPALPPTTRRLMETTSALLTTREVPDQATVDFALSSLRTVLLADAANHDARQRLELLTRQLADEATRQFDIGNGQLASRLIRQALSTGVAAEHVRLAAAYTRTEI